MKKTLRKFGLALGLGLTVANSLSAQDCYFNPNNTNYNLKCA